MLLRLAVKKTKKIIQWTFITTVFNIQSVSYEFLAFFVLEIFGLLFRLCNPHCCAWARAEE